MARRMEIELTSSRDDDTWTWRAAGARQPRGVVAAKMLPQSSKVGDVLRVEAEFELEGITVVAIVPTRERSNEPARIEILAPPRGAIEPVTTSLVARTERGRGRERRDFDDRPRAGGDRPGRGAPRPRTGAPAGEGRPRPERSAGADRGEARPGAPRREPRPDRPSARPSPAGAAATHERPNRARPARLVPGNAHRDALLATLPPEQRPVAEQLAQGGLPAVRRALAEEQAAARAAGRPPLGGEAMIALAEQLLPGIREATWLDRAESAVAMLETISLRDLRASVVGAAPRDDTGRELLNKLREALNERLTKLRDNWEHEITHALEEGRVLQALRTSARPPEPSARFPAALVQPLAQAAGTALSAATPAERWLALLEAASASPIRRSIKPEGIPEDPDGSVRQAATLAAGRIPAIAALLGLAMPPPPGPLARRPPRPPASVRPAGATRPAPPRPTPGVDQPGAPDADPGTSTALDAVSEEPAVAFESAPLPDPPETPLVEQPATQQAAGEPEPSATLPEGPVGDQPVELEDDAVADEPGTQAVAEGEAEQG